MPYREFPLKNTKQRTTFLNSKKMQTYQTATTLHFTFAAVRRGGFENVNLLCEYAVHGEWISRYITLYNYMYNVIASLGRVFGLFLAAAAHALSLRYCRFSLPFSKFRNDGTVERH